MSSVLLIGATGATGRKVLQELLQDGKVEKVTTFTRKPLAQEHPKLHQVIVENFDQLESTPIEEWKGEVIINAIGTTRAISGGGEQFVHVERDYSEMAMRMAKKAGVKRSITVSAMGANANLPIAPMWFHPLLYTKTLGEKENAATKQGFEKTVIFQPGMLDREVEGGPGSWLAKFPLLGALPVSTLAKAVVNAVNHDQAQPVTRITGNATITKFAQQ